MCIEINYIFNAYIYKEDPALNNLQWLMYNKPNRTKKEIYPCFLAKIRIILLKYTVFLATPSRSRKYIYIRIILLKYTVFLLFFPSNTK